MANDIPDNVANPSLYRKAKEKPKPNLMFTRVRMLTDGWFKSINAWAASTKAQRKKRQAVMCLWIRKKRPQQRRQAEQV